MPDNHQSENASGKCGLVSVVFHTSWSGFSRDDLAQPLIDKEIFTEEEHEWYEADSELPARIEYLRENAEGSGYILSDCHVSLAEYNELELTEQNISSIKTFFLFIN